MKEIYDFLKPYLPSDHHRQASASGVASNWCQKNQPIEILDLGCGAGNTIDFFSRVAPNAHWSGLDIEDSPEVRIRTRGDGDFFTYDGRTFPFGEASFDLIYTRQVLEHVRYPEQVLAEVARVLRPGATLIGSTSHLEPYHSFSFWNYTVFGFAKLLIDAGLQPVAFRPGIDGATLIERSKASDRAPYQGYFERESPGNASIEQDGVAQGQSTKQINFRKLMYCGHFVFTAQKVSSQATE